ncbi:restriction endonuclease subunit S [Vibrio vulnificus]|uniref:restriction endonuclease subunit S n=1 Tax=Vibrio vulnificus TaxID=672 RepID=UPI001CDD7B2A|nr:restriction endonuclease subunit S [Vibrio vulnificus]MCA3925657.1 restriction endonuclease subunit S [Vibrio vulnificus]
MSDLPTVKVSECCDILDNLRIPLNAEEREKIKGNIPYCGANGIQGYISEYIFDEDLILLAEDGGNFDEYQTRPIAYRISGKSWVNNHAHVLRVKEGYDFSFVFYSLQHKNLIPFIKGGTRAKLNQAELREITIWDAPFPIQQRIGEIIETIDNQIDATQALIDKYTAIKQGMMADLFSRGIDPETKALRPTYEEAAELYHETPLGMLPKGWDAYDIEDISDVIDPNPSHRNPIYRADGFAFISTVEFIEGDSVETNTSRRVAESVVLEQERRCAFNENSIVFSRKGTIGETRFVPTSCRFALLDSLCVLNPKNVDVTYFYHSLRSPSLKTQINQMVMGQALPQVSIGRVRELLIPMPNDAMEQRLIGQRIGGIVELLNSELLHLRKLQAQKSGLMQDLLTGKVPVPA